MSAGRLRAQEGWAVVIAMCVMAAMIALGLASFAFVDSQVTQSAREKFTEVSFDYASGVLDTEAYLVGAAWPSSSGAAMPDCTYNGITVIAAGGTGSLNSCPVQSRLANTYSGSDYGGSVLWTAMIRDNPGTEQCALTQQNQCSYYWDDSLVSSAPAWDANGDGQVWVRVRVTIRGKTTALVERVQLDQQPVNFPAAAITAQNLVMTDTPHVHLVTNYSPINLRCTDDTQLSCVNLKKKRQVAPYKINLGYPNQTAIPSTALDQLRIRAKAEGSYYATCPTSRPTKLFIFVESGNCHGSQMPITTPTQQGVWIQAAGTLTTDGLPKPPPGPPPKGQKKATGGYYGLIYLANGEGASATHLNSSSVFKMTGGRNLIQGIVAVDWTGGVTLGGNKDASLTYDPVALGGLYTYAGNTIVRPSFKQFNTNTP